MLLKWMADYYRKWRLVELFSGGVEGMRWTGWVEGWRGDKRIGWRFVVIVMGDVSIEVVMGW